MLVPGKPSYQQTTEPSVFTPHAYLFPTLIDENAPVGGMAWPQSSPQHAMVASFFTPHP
jgi:hypothetical protein